MTYPTLGVELEMGVIDEAGRSACVDNRYFHSLAHRLSEADDDLSFERSDDRIVGLKSRSGVNGIDNGFNLLETALAPQTAGSDTLCVLAAEIDRDLSRVLGALRSSGLALTSLAQHPTAGTGHDWYRKACAPKSVYRYLCRERGWNHPVGIDAKAQNGPTTGVTVATAVDALNLLLAASPAFIALFANSPFEDGRETGVKETRMTLWPRMVGTSVVAADRGRVGLPPRPFQSIDDYFMWMFADDTVMHAIPADNSSYKGDGSLYVVGDGRLTAARFFRDGPWAGRNLDGLNDAVIQPSGHHFQFLQWSNFLDFRIRFAFGNDSPSADQLSAAFLSSSGFNEIFASCAHTLYIENRCVGATFVDDDLGDQVSDDVSASSMVAASALQAGLVAAAPSAIGPFLDRWNWSTINTLRKAAIKDALGGDNAVMMRRFVDDVLGLAADHLPAKDQRYLAYPAWVLGTGLTGADRALAHAARLGLAGRDGLTRLARLRSVRIAPAMTGPADAFHPAMRS